MKLALLLLSCLLLAGCSQDGYMDTLENWRDEQAATAYENLQGQYNEVSSELVEVKGKYLQAEAINEQLNSDIKALQKKNTYLEYQLSIAPSPADFTGHIKALQELATANNELRDKFIDLMDLWKGLKVDYKELAEAFKEAVATGNFTDNQTRDYLDIIKVIE